MVPREAELLAAGSMSMQFRLRYLHHDLELLEGQFVVGRSTTCQLSLDDPLVSRRHAMFAVSREGATVEDLGSRNGVIVNGKRISGRVPLKEGDKIEIGAQEFELQRAAEGAARDAADIRRTLSSITVPPDAESEPTALREQGSLPSLPSPSGDEEPSILRRAGAMSSLGSVAEKALAMGRADDAERILATALASVRETSRAGKRVASDVVDQAARVAAKLATATGKGSWVDYVVELYKDQDRPCPAPIVDELYAAMGKVSAVDLAQLRAYIAALRARQATLGPAERFVVQRLVGLEQLAALL